ncbi:type I DNA topoisomerase [Telmatospirillum sp.]|uniref:type I DNA topoisomerase n=1 Tax=Telmatospirillum sp. TaxID=2079197 RepID=UPI00283CF31D|nr:type I DNA topoisomerase [Telmatospirillum sp.]MDR3441363.1 type I DNA topoisomerase [Telmatospirillum sp.]
MKIVVVESPAKAKTINKYLGSDYTVLASWGHICDLPAKDGSVRPDDDFSMDWEIDAKSEKHIRDIAQAVKKSDGLILATDPDREGEAISWHVYRVLESRKALKGIDVKRVVFNEITKTAILEAMRNPRDLDQELVDAYLARRALDYLVGFTLSPVLWRKLPGSRSAGRVQSVALRLICEREGEIENFRAQEYWTVEADFLSTRQAQIGAQLTRLDGTKLDKFDLGTEAAAKTAVDKVLAAHFHVETVERKQAKRHPYPPFTTSTLQQEASRKLLLPASRTMQVAQRLYEGIDIGGETVGLITYMRTDGVQMAAEAIGAARALIEQQYGAPYLPSAPRVYKTKAKNAQEAHEAIRPTDVSRRPQDVAPYLDREQLKLYELIWRRTVASQMESALLDQVAVDIGSEDGKIAFRATGSVVKFDGFLTLYREDRDDSDDDEGDKLLPDVNEGETMERKDLRKLQHFTQPPPRYSEASLVKKLEELGIGRPSTYASILSVLQERSYVRLDARRFIPEDRGRVVTAFLENFFNRYVQYNFTAELEDQLDDVSGGRLDWKSVLRTFWQHFSAAVEGTRELRVSQVLETLDKELGPHFFPADASGHDPRTCKLCNTGRLSLKLGKFGAFIGCSNYPECRFTRPLTIATNGDGTAADEAADGPKELGLDPASNQMVTLKKGPYGHYVQLGESEDKKVKPKRVSLYKGLDPVDVTLDKALKLLALPRPIGTHPETGEPITAGIGRFGPYLKHGAIYKSLGRDDDVLEIGINRAVEVLATAKGKARTPGKTLGEHPSDSKPVVLNSGRFGPYVSHAGIYANLPRGRDDVTLEEALALLAAKAAKGGTKGKAGKAKAAPKAKAAVAEKADGADVPATKAKAKAKPKAKPKTASTTASKVKKTPTKSKATSKSPAQE